MSQLPLPKLSVLNSLASLKDELKSEASTALKSPANKFKVLDSKQTESNRTSPKNTLKSPNGWSSLQNKGFGAALSMITEDGNQEKNKFSKFKKKGPETLGNSRRESIQKETPNLIVEMPECDYASLIMCFPENIRTKSQANPFYSFNPFSDLVQTADNKHDGKRLKTILEENMIIKTAREGERYPDKRDLMKKVLEFNKMQQRYYIKQTTAEKRTILLPLIKQVKEKAKHIPPVKILASRKNFEDEIALKVGIEDNNSVDRNSPIPKQELNPSASAPSLQTNEKKRPSHLKGYEEKLIEQGFQVSVYNYKVFWTYNATNDPTWKPATREGHTFVTVGRQIVLYGGLSTSLLEDIILYDPAKNIWTQPQTTGDIPMSGRHGHTACEYKKALVIFGGEHQFNQTLNIRECLNDTRMFIPDKNEWKHMKTSSQITPRRHHATTVHNHLMYVYGGINNEGKYIKDAWALNLRSYSWDKIDVTGDKENGTAFHAMCACYIDKTNISSKEKDKSRTFEEGVYVFGGKTGEGKILNTLKFFPFGSKTPQWVYPITKGNSPTPRYNHTMIFYEPLGILVVYGGRNESLYESLGDICLNDIRILNLAQMTWSQATSHGDIPKVGRYHHGAALFGSKMLIFGGVEFKNYADDEVKSVELNQSKVKNALNMDQEEEASYDNSKTGTGSLLPPVKNKKKLQPQVQFLTPRTESKSQIISWLPIPTSKLADYKEDETPKLTEKSVLQDRSPSILSKFRLNKIEAAKSNLERK